MQVWKSFIQDYFDLTAARLRANLLDPVRLNALWDIWQWRDYKAYGELNGTTYALAQWPVVDRMRLYIRKEEQAIAKAILKEVAVSPEIVQDIEVGGKDMVDLG